MKDLKDLTLRYIGDYSPGTGWNIALRGYLRALQALGLDAGHVRGVLAVGGMFSQMAKDTPSEDWTYRYLHSMWREDPPINIVHTHVSRFGDFWTAGKYNIAIVIWETDKLPQRSYVHFSKKATVVESLNKYDEVWVPTRWIGGLVRDSGINPPNGVHVIPHALLPELAKVAEEAPEGAKDLCQDEPEVGFLAVGTWNARKNMEQLFQAYLATGWKPLRDRVALRIYSVPPARESAIIMENRDIATAQIQATLATIPDGPEEAPPYGLYTAYVPQQAVAQRYTTNHVFVTASRGEAFQLPAMEAAAFGCWIVGGGPWLQELAEVAGTVKEGGLVDLLPTTLTPIAAMPEVTGYEIGQKWWHIQQEDITEAMVAAKDAILEVGAFRGTEYWAKRVREHYSVRRIAGLIKKRLLAAKASLEGSGW